MNTIPEKIEITCKWMGAENDCRTVATNAEFEKILGFLKSQFDPSKVPSIPNHLKFTFEQRQILDAWGAHWTPESKAYIKKMRALFEEIAKRSGYHID